MVTIFVIPHCKQLFIVVLEKGKTLLSGDGAHLGAEERSRHKEKDSRQQKGRNDERQTREDHICV